MCIERQIYLVHSSIKEILIKKKKQLNLALNGWKDIHCCSVISSSKEVNRVCPDKVDLDPIKINLVFARVKATFNRLHSRNKFPN